MAVFRVRGRTRWGEPFAVRFDAPEARTVEAWLAAEGAAVEHFARLPLTAWPFARFMVMILLFPFFAYGLFMSLAVATFLVLDLGREAAVRGRYVELAERGVRTVGTVGEERRRSLRGARRRTFDYAFVDGAGVRRAGWLAAIPGDPAAGRHDLRLLDGEELRPGDELAVTHLADRPEVHAPFAAGPELLARFDALAAERRRQAAQLAVAIPCLGWMIWNLLIRTGSHYVLSPRDPRLVLITRGESPFVEAEESARA